MTSPRDSLLALEWFESLAETGTEERRRRLGELHSSEPELAAAVRDLLAADGEKGLDTPFEPAAVLADAFGPQSGDRLGPFELVGAVGEGGMGTVWEARRIEGGFAQRVAIKFLRLPGFDARAERRFAFERELLGKLRHPAIAGILDAGRTAAGAPYLVMEYVDGVRIDEYCDRHALSIRERVRLMVEICRVVAHAHRNLVVHRDLKPANILVTDGGEPRLLDFGIAKLLGDEEERVALTVEGLGPMTLQYASPEQILGLPVATTSDVYSLGVVLYQLLTGRTPFGGSATSPLELGRSVAEVDVRSPSSAVRVDSLERDDDLPAVIEARGLSAASQLRRELRGDLDNVALAALQRDPERRYRSVDALAADLEAWLRGFPVQARGDSLAYRTAKFLRRNWIAVTAGCLVVASLAVGLGVAMWNAKEARQQRDRADDHAQRTEMVNRFLVDLLAAPGGRWWRDLENKGPETRVIDVIDEAAARLEVDLEAAPLQRAALHQTLNDTYLALGQFDRAEHQVRQALTIRQRELGVVHPAVAESSYYLAATFKRQRRLPESLEAYRSALAIERKLPEPTGNYPHALTEAASAAARIGLHGEADGLNREAVDFARRNDPKMEAFFLARWAWCRAEAGRLDQAEALIREAERRFDTTTSDGAALRTFSQSMQVGVYWLSDDLERAAEISQHPGHDRVEFWRAQVLYDLGLFDEALRLVEPGSGGDDVSEFQVLRSRLALESGGDVATCLARIEPAVAFEEAVAMGPTWYLAEARAALAACLVARGEPADLERAQELRVRAKETLDSLFDRPTPLHRRIEATTVGGPGGDGAIDSGVASPST